MWLFQVYENSFEQQKNTYVYLCQTFLINMIAFRHTDTNFDKVWQLKVNAAVLVC